MIFSNNLKFLRKTRQPKVTQSDVAELLGVNVSTYGAYEEGRAEPRLENLRKLSLFFMVSMEDLLETDLQNRSEAETQHKSAQVVAGPNVLVTTVDADGNDNIEWVSEKAAAGYTAGYGDPEFVQQLPVFGVPFLDKRKKFRLFTIQGDSMLPIPSGALVFAEYLENWSQIKDDSLCIVVTRSEGVVFKKVKNYLKKQHCLLLISTNPLYEPYVIGADDVLEIWLFSGFFSQKFPENS